jgi:hypothetical protein
VPAKKAARIAACYLRRRKHSRLPLSPTTPHGWARVGGLCIFVHGTLQPHHPPTQGIYLPLLCAFLHGNLHKYPALFGYIYILASGAESGEVTEAAEDRKRGERKELG